MSESTKSPVRVQLVLAAHQPLSATDETLELALDAVYRPLLDMLEGSDVKVALHLGGHLLDFLAKKHEAELLRIKELARAQKVEVLGGLFYGGVPALLSEMDVRGQVQMLSEFWQSVLGWAPQGFFLPELAWSVELPRLLQDSGLNYGFASASQLVGVSQTGLGVIERGDQRVAAFVLDPHLSQTVATRPADEWIEALLDRGGRNEGVLSVWTRVEQALPILPALLQALSTRSEVATLLPNDSYNTARPAAPFKVTERCAQELVGGGEHLEWTDFARLYPEAETVLRRMQRASDKLKESIAMMEDEELEDSWTDVLATAQRLVFSAQTHDAYWTAPGRAGCLDPALRNETVGRLIRAEAMLDALVQGNEDWIATEEEDLDADLSDEVFVCTRHLTAWVAPQNGGAVRGIDQRLAGRNILDMSALRPEGVSDGGVVRELSERLLDDRASAAELFSGSATDLLPKRSRWKVGKSAIDEEGDCNYHLELSGKFGLAGVSARELSLKKSVIVPIDAPEIRVQYDIELSGSPEVTLAGWMPLAFSPGALKLTVNGEAKDFTPELVDVETLAFEDEAGVIVELRCAPRCDVWLERRPEGGVVVAPNLRISGSATAELVWSFPSGVDESVVEEEVAEDEELYEEEEGTEEGADGEVYEEEEETDATEESDAVDPDEMNN